MRIGLGGVVVDQGLIILICFDARDGVGVTNRIEFEVSKRITRGVISCVV